LEIFNLLNSYLNCGYLYEPGSKTAYSYKYLPVQRTLGSSNSNVWHVSSLTL